MSHNFWSEAKVGDLVACHERFLPLLHYTLNDATGSILGSTRSSSSRPYRRLSAKDCCVVLATPVDWDVLVTTGACWAFLLTPLGPGYVMWTTGDGPFADCVFKKIG